MHATLRLHRSVISIGEALEGRVELDADGRHIDHVHVYLFGTSLTRLDTDVGVYGGYEPFALSSNTSECHVFLKKGLSLYDRSTSAVLSDGLSYVMPFSLLVPPECVCSYCMRPCRTAPSFATLTRSAYVFYRVELHVREAGAWSSLEKKCVNVYVLPPRENAQPPLSEPPLSEPPPEYTPVASTNATPTLADASADRQLAQAFADEVIQDPFGFVATSTPPERGKRSPSSGLATRYAYVHTRNGVPEYTRAPRDTARWVPADASPLLPHDAAVTDVLCLKRYLLWPWCRVAAEMSIPSMRASRHAFGGSRQRLHLMLTLQTLHAHGPRVVVEQFTLKLYQVLHMRANMEMSVVPQKSGRLLSSSRAHVLEPRSALAIDEPFDLPTDFTSHMELCNVQCEHYLCVKVVFPGVHNTFRLKFPFELV